MTEQKDIVGTEFPRKIPRYFCRGADGPAGHCDDRPHTIQCDYCIWIEDNPGKFDGIIERLNKPLD